MIRINILQNRLLRSSLLGAMTLGLMAFGGNSSGDPEKRAVSIEIKPPTGLWVWQAESKPYELSVTILQRHGEWTTRVNNQTFPVTVKGKQLSLKAMNGQSFAGTISEDGNSVSGYWQQPTTELAYSTMITKVELYKEQRNKEGINKAGIGDVNKQSWSGNVKLQPRPFHVFLDIFDDVNGGYKAVIRNPERNQIMRSARFEVQQIEAERWKLVATRGSRNIEAPFRLMDKQTLQLTHSWFAKPLNMVPANKRQSARYYSRVTRDSVAKYTKPRQKNDGWQTMSANESGFDETILQELLARLSNAEPRDTPPNLIHSMLIAHQGRLVFEEYFYGHDEKTAHDTRSLTKVLGSVMVGAMQSKGHSISADDKLFETPSPLARVPIDDARKRDISLGHIMSYTSGLDCDDISGVSLGEEDTMWQQQKEQNFWLFTAKLPQIYKPGERYAYCSGSANLVGSSINAKMKMPIFEAFHQLIAQPLQFSPYHWNLMPNGDGYLGGGVYMRPRDILKIGALYAGDGTWNGIRLVSQEWIKESTKTNIAITPETTKMTPDEFSNNYFGGGQAYIWRTDKITTKVGEFDAFEATGNGGQILLVVPKLELTVVFTGGNYLMGSVWGRWRNDLVGRYVIPALAN